MLQIRIQDQTLNQQFANQPFPVNGVPSNQNGQQFPQNSNNNGPFIPGFSRPNQFNSQNNNGGAVILGSSRPNQFNPQNNNGGAVILGSSQSNSQPPYGQGINSPVQGKDNILKK